MDEKIKVKKTKKLKSIWESQEEWINWRSELKLVKEFLSIDFVPKTTQLVELLDVKDEEDLDSNEIESLCLWRKLMARKIMLISQ